MQATLSLRDNGSKVICTTALQLLKVGQRHQTVYYLTLTSTGRVHRRTQLILERNRVAMVVSE